MLTREEVWQRFADEIGAVYFSGDFWSPERIVMTIPPWEITIQIVNEGTQPACTQLSADYISRDGLLFSVFRRFSFEDTGPLLNEPTVPIGDNLFDSLYRIVGTPPAQVKRLLANTAIRNYMLWETHIGLSVENNSGPGTPAKLICQVIGMVNERKRLLGLLELMGETLQYLCVIGSADETAIVP